MLHQLIWEAGSWYHQGVFDEIYSPRELNAPTMRMATEEKKALRRKKKNLGTTSDIIPSTNWHLGRLAESSPAT